MADHSDVSIRLAERADSACILEWRNDPLTVANSVTPGTVTQADHDRWFARILSDPAHSLYVGLNATGKVGVCRFDVDAARNRAEVSINLNPAVRGAGLALPLLQGAIAAFTAGRVVTLTATVKHGNAPSQKTFTRCGFLLRNSDGQCSYYVRDSR